MDQVGPPGTSSTTTSANAPITPTSQLLEDDELPGLTRTSPPFLPFSSISWERQGLKWIDGVEFQYNILIKFDAVESSTDSFHRYFGGKQFSSLEGGVCHVRSVEDVHYTQLIEHAHSSAQQPTCPICLGVWSTT